MQHSRAWHACFDAIQFGPVPVIAVLHGAVVGGGLELAVVGAPARGRGQHLLRPARRHARHLRRRRRLGAHQPPDRRGPHDRHDADRPRVRRRRGPGLRAISNYRVADGAGLAKAAGTGAPRSPSNAPLSNYAITQALPRIADLSASDGLFVESLMAQSIAQGDEAAKIARARLPGKAAPPRWAKARLTAAARQAPHEPGSTSTTVNGAVRRLRPRGHRVLSRTSAAGWMKRQPGLLHGAAACRPGVNW